MSNPVYHGSCLCGGVTYTVTGPIKAVSHCHCSMCRKIHGTAFGSYGSVRLQSHRFIHGEHLLQHYASSDSITRSFCSVCGSPLRWQGSQAFPDWVSFPLGTLDSPFVPQQQKHVHTESKALWYDLPGDATRS